MSMDPNDPYPSDSWEAEKYRWLCISQFVADPAFTQFKLPPPSQSDARAEIAEIKKHFGLRAARIGAIEAQSTDVVSPFQAAVPFTRLHHKNTYELATMLKELGRYLVMYYKDKFNRVRPHHVDPSVDEVIAVPGHPAYPSGHTLQSHLIAHGLSSLFPKAKTELFAAAWEISFNREVAGVHYRSDTLAGISLADQAWPIVNDSAKCPAIANIMKRARAELQARPLAASGTDP